MFDEYSSYPTKVLVADDVALMRDLLRSVLRSLGHDNVIEASNGADALRLYRRERPAITFLDIKMPGRDGLEVLETIRQEAPAAFVAIVSAEGTVENLQKAIGQGASAFVVKPYRGKSIQDALEKFYGARAAG